MYLQRLDILGNISLILGEKITLVIGELAVMVYDVNSDTIAASVDIPNHPIASVNLGAK